MEDLIINGKQADTQEMIERLEHVDNYEKNKKLWYAENDSRFWKWAKKVRESNKPGSKEMRLIASVPEDIYEAILYKYGEDVFRDEKLFKEILKREEKLQWSMTVPMNSL